MPEIRNASNTLINKAVTHATTRWRSLTGPRSLLWWVKTICERVLASFLVAHFLLILWLYWGLYRAVTGLKLLDIHYELKFEQCLHVPNLKSLSLWTFFDQTKPLQFWRYFGASDPWKHKYWRKVNLVETSYNVSRVISEVYMGYYLKLDRLRMQLKSLYWLSHHGIWGSIPYWTNISVVSKGLWIF